MIPTKTMQAPPSPPRRHAHYANPLLKLASFEDFLAIKAQTTSIQSPCLSKEESMSQPWPTEDGKDQEMSQESPTCSKAPLCTESGKFVVIKQEIAIPLAKRAFESPMKPGRSGEVIFKQYKSQLGYKRFDYTKTLVNNDVYEATDRDIKFLSELNKEILDGCPELTTSQFEKIIECWEHETREDIIITVEEAIAAAEGSMDVTIEDVSLLTKIYEYWKNSREDFRRPLLRKYWRAANNEDANPNIAFQRRKENRFARRRSQRMTSPLDDLKRMKNLKKNLDRGRMLLANVRLKEMVKFELQEVRGKTFEEQVRQELGEDLDIELKTPLSTQTGLSEEKYLEVRRKMQEYMTKGESTLKSLKRLKQGALTATKKTYKKHSINSVDTSSSILQEELQPATFKPMPFVLNKLSSYLPRQIQGSFTVPIRKSAIELNELKAKLRQSIGSLYKRDQEELLVKVDLGDTTGSPIIKEPFNACEELSIRLELEERVVNLEDGKIKQSTVVRYYITFQEGLQTKTPLLELVPKEPIKFEPNFQPRSDLNVELLSLKKNNSVGKELVLTLSQNKDGLSAGKNSSGEGEIHF